MKINRQLWHRHEGKDIWLFTLSSDRVTVQVTNLGCTIVSINIFIKNTERNIVLGYNNAADYLSDKYYVGSLAGRYAGRISGAILNIHGKEHLLTDNEKGNHLHGGNEGFNKKVFEVSDFHADEDSAAVTFHYCSSDGEEGYPGNLPLSVSLSLNRSNEISISYEATTDKPTVINLTHHCYYNLTGSADAMQQQLKVNAGMYLPADKNYIPTGEIATVDNTRYDLRKGGSIHRFNEYFIFERNDLLEMQAELTDEETGLRLELYTSLPGLVLYTGDYLEGAFQKNQGICLETQFYPDSPNHSQFPSTILEPGNEYSHQTVLKLRNIPGDFLG